MTPISLDSLNATDRDSFVAVLGDVFEHAPWVASAIYAGHPFANIHDLYQAMVDVVQSANDERKLALIEGHPELAGETMRAGLLTSDSAAEQESAGLNRLTSAELATFQKLNDSYRSKFEIPFIICVRRHGKDSLFQHFRRRLQNERSAEFATALKEIFRIAALRLDQRVIGPDRLNVHGCFSTHILDTYHGRPASGVVIQFFETGA